MKLRRQYAEKYLSIGLLSFVFAQGPYTLSFDLSQFKFSVENGFDRVRGMEMSATTDTSALEWLTRQEFIWYGDTIIGEPPSRAVAGPETLVVLYTQGTYLGNPPPPQPVPDFWESIWDVNCSTPFSITRFYKEMSYGKQIINAYPRAHWTGTWHYCFQVDYNTPGHGGPWSNYCKEAVIAADPEVNFGEYAGTGQYVWVVVLCLWPGGGSGICWLNGLQPPIPTNDVNSNGQPVYVLVHWALRGDAWAHSVAIGALVSVGFIPG